MTRLAFFSLIFALCIAAPLRAAVQTVADVGDAVDYGTPGPNDSVRFTGLRGGRGSAILTSRAR